MIAATATVLMMTIPGLALFYAGTVRKKNVLATMAQSLAATALASTLWIAFGYSLTFTGDGAWIGLPEDRWRAGQAASKEEEREGLDISLHGEALQ